MAWKPSEQTCVSMAVRNKVFLIENPATAKQKVGQDPHILWQFSVVCLEITFKQPAHTERVCEHMFSSMAL